MQRIVAAILVSLFAIPGGALAQTACEGPCSVTPSGDRAVTSGALRAATLKEAVRLSKTLLSTSLRQAPTPQRSWAKRHPVVVGTLVGFGAGLGFFVVACSDCDSANPLYGPSALAMGGVGAGIGAAVGFAVSR